MPARNIVMGDIEDPIVVEVAGMFDRDHSDDEHTRWLDEFGEGVFTRYISHIHHKDEECRSRYRFSDPDTAFAFRVRFG